jgi:hypothetical protein
MLTPQNWQNDRVTNKIRRESEAEEIFGLGQPNTTINIMKDF